MHDRDIEDKEKERELASHDGGRPVEEVGPTQADPGAPRCETKAAVGGAPHDSHFMVGDEVHEGFPVEPLRPYIAEDGLPSFDFPTPEQTEAIPFAYETVVCVEDDREYVEVFVEELEDRGWRLEGGRLNAEIAQMASPPGASRGSVQGPDVPLSVRSRYGLEGEERERRTFEPAEVEHLWGTHLAKLTTTSGSVRFLPLRMRRERCEHYRRQVFSNDEVPDPQEFGHKIVFRNCAARRSNGGAYLSLRDEGVYSCDYRSPRDEASVAAQDKIDAEKLRDRPHLRRLPLFGLPGDEIHLTDADNN
ncbi:MAG: hypothetical protein GY772_06705 [bacterium]|nr:hypothetical protein [bacterium]